MENSFTKVFLIIYNDSLRRRDRPVIAFFCLPFYQRRNPSRSQVSDNTRHSTNITDNPMQQAKHEISLFYRSVEQRVADTRRILFIAKHMHR